jgi:hypothetical protein
VIRLVRTAKIAGLLIAVSVMGTPQNAVSGNDSSAPAGGTICVLPNSPDPPTRISPGGDYNPTTLTVRIDDRKPLPWPHKEPIRIENIGLDGRHLLVLTSDGKRIQSLWFRFSQYKDVKLCLAFDGYQGVQLEDKRTALWCKCK